MALSDGAITVNIEPIELLLPQSRAPASAALHAANGEADTGGGQHRA
jgi:hypothetical protein